MLPGNNKHGQPGNTRMSNSFIQPTFPMCDSEPDAVLYGGYRNEWREGGLSLWNLPSIWGCRHVSGWPTRTHGHLVCRLSRLLSKPTGGAPNSSKWDQGRPHQYVVSKTSPMSVRGGSSREQGRSWKHGEECTKPTQGRKKLGESEDVKKVNITERQRAKCRD
jgi:hypothetical protein